MSSNNGSLEKKPMEAMSSIIHRALQRLCAVFAKDLFRTQDLNNETQMQQIFVHFHGEGGVASQVDLLLEGYGHYKRLQKRKDVYKTGFFLKTNGKLSLIPCFIGVRMKNIIYHDNLNSKILKQSALKKGSSNLKGQSIMAYASKEIAGRKKFASLMPKAVQSGIIQGPCDGCYQYSSGKGTFDLMNFVLTQMFNWENIYGATGASVDAYNADKVASTDVDCGQDEEDAEKLIVPPRDYLPTGFILFWLRGNHPENPPENHLELFALDDGAKVKDAGRKLDRVQKLEDKIELKKLKKTTMKIKNANVKSDDAIVKKVSKRDLAFTMEQNATKIRQNERKMDLCEFSSKLLKLNQLLQSKHKMFEYDFKMLDFYMKLDDNIEARKVTESIKQVQKDIAELEDNIQSLEEQKRNPLDEELSTHAKSILGIKLDSKKSNTSPPSSMSTITELTNPPPECSNRPASSAEKHKAALHLTEVLMTPSVN